MIGKQILNYRIISLLGEGGMGSVYKAFDLQLERYVAIKIINPKLIKNPTYLERFRNEAKNQAKLTHPNIVAVYGFIETREAIGFVMEFVDGKTVSQLISEYGRLEVVYSLRIIQQVLIAIEYAHSLGYIHRDLKPSNIIIDNKGIVKVMDFGISKSLTENQNLTRAGFNIGTIHYMSPEQIKGFTLTPRTDLYSIAVTLFEMISGNPPFNFNSDYEIYDAHLKMLPPKLGNTFTDIPAEVDELILSAMNKSNKTNFQNATEFRRALESLIFHLPLLAYKPTVQSNTESNKAVKKHRSANLIIGITLIITFIVIGISYLLVERFILKTERKNRLIENNGINYLKSSVIFQADWEQFETGLKDNVNNLISLSENLYLSGTRTVYHSTDWGKTWTNFFNSGSLINDIALMKNKILVSGENGILYFIGPDKKIEKKKLPTNENLLSLCTKGVILIGSSSGELFIVDEKGLNPKKIIIPQSSGIKSIEQIENNIFIGDMNGNVFSSSDNGTTWSKNEIGGGYVRKIVFLNSFRGFLLSSDGTLKMTTNSGKDWNLVPIKINTIINDIIFVNQKMGFMCTSDGNLLVSGNSGQDWLVEKLTTIPLIKVLALNNGIILVVANNGMIFRNKI